jgi:hypothetical protein
MPLHSAHSTHDAGKTAGPQRSWAMAPLRRRPVPFHDAGDGPLRPLKQLNVPCSSRDCRIIIALALIVTVLLSMGEGLGPHYRFKLSLQVGAKGAGDSSNPTGGKAAAVDSGSGGGHSVQMRTGRAQGAGAVAAESLQRREERRARRQEKVRTTATATATATPLPRPVDDRKLQPGEGNAVTHTRIFETGSLLQDGRAPLEYAHMGMLEEVSGGGGLHTTARPSYSPRHAT